METMKAANNTYSWSYLFGMLQQHIKQVPFSYIGVSHIFHGKTKQAWDAAQEYQKGMMSIYHT